MLAQRYQTYLIVGAPSPQYDEDAADHLRFVERFATSWAMLPRLNVTLVPISGIWWDDWYELCLHPCLHTSCTHCWVDLLVLQPESRLALTLKSHLMLRNARACYTRAVDLAC